MPSCLCLRRAAKELSAAESEAVLSKDTVDVKGLEAGVADVDPADAVDESPKSSISSTSASLSEPLSLLSLVSLSPLAVAFVYGFFLIDTSFVTSPRFFEARLSTRLNFFFRNAWKCCTEGERRTLKRQMFFCI